MQKISVETLIIGAGPAGMACAMELSKGNKDFLLVEADSRVGGLSKTYSFTDSTGLTFYTDNGPHRFFSKNQYLYEFIGDLLKEDWILVNRQTRQYIDGKFYDYPINATQALKNVGVIQATKMLWDYLFSRIEYRVFKKSIKNFRDYVVAHFGKTLGEFNMINYTEKIWGIDASTIHPDWAKQRIHGLNLRVILKDILQRPFSKYKVHAKSLVDNFYYPRNGTGQIYESIKIILSQKGYVILTETRPAKIHKTSGGFKTILKKKDGGEIEILSKYIVESVPIGEFIKILEEKTPVSVETALKNLQYRSQVYLFITLNKDSLTKDQWIYFPSKNTPIGRISEMKNFSPSMSPAGKTSLFVEFFCFEGDSVWNMSREQLLEHSLPWLVEMGLFTREDIRDYYHIKKNNVYPVYDLSYKKHLEIIKEYLDNIPNLFFIGRPGRFRYNNQDHSLEMGILAAKSIIDNKKYDIDSVGEEKEYFESGNIYEKK